MSRVGEPVLTYEELDELEFWARAGRESDPSDRFPVLLLRLIQENAELRELLNELNGEVRLSRKLASENDRLKMEVEKLESIRGHLVDRLMEYELCKPPEKILIRVGETDD